MDYKTGGEHWAEVTKQEAAYRFCDGIGVYDEAGWLTGLRELPKVDAAFVLYVHDDASYALRWLPVDVDAWQAFLDLREHYRWTKDFESWERKVRKHG